MDYRGRLRRSIERPSAAPAPVEILPVVVGLSMHRETLMGRPLRTPVPLRDPIGLSITVGVPVVVGKGWDGLPDRAYLNGLDILDLMGVCGLTDVLVGGLTEVVVYALTEVLVGGLEVPLTSVVTLGGRRVRGGSH